MTKALKLALTALAFLISTTKVARLFAAAVIEAKYEGRFRTVIDAKDFRPVVIYKSKRKIPGQLTYKLKLQEGTYTDGFYELKNESFRATDIEDVSTGSRYNSGLQFSGQLKVDTSLKDCFMVVEFLTARGEKSILIRELPDLKPNRWEQIEWSFQTDTTFTNANYAYYFFSEGKQIPKIGTKTKSDPIDPPLRPGEFFPEEFPVSIKSPKAEFPESLIGVIDKGTVRLKFRLLETGRAVDIEVLSSTHPDLEAPAIESVKNSIWKPARHRGKDVPLGMSKNIFMRP